MDGTRCPRGGLREFLGRKQLSDTKFIEDLGRYGLVDVDKLLPSYRAVLSSIKQRRRFPINKPDTHGARILQAWVASCGKHHRDDLSLRTESIEPPAKRPRIAVEREHIQQPVVEEGKEENSLADELRPCIESLKCRCDFANQNEEVCVPL